MLTEYIKSLTLKERETYLWNSVDFIEHYICHLMGWDPMDGKLGTDAWCPTRGAIEIKTSSYTGVPMAGDKAPRKLAGGFTVSQLSQEIAERLRTETIFIFGKDDETKSFPYIISISGEELYQDMMKHLRSGGAATYHRSYKTYMNFESLEIHVFDLEFVKAYPEKFSDKFVAFMMGGELEYEKVFHRFPIEEHVEIIGVNRTGSGKRQTVHYAYHHHEYNITVVRSSKALNKTAIDWAKEFENSVKQMMIMPLRNEGWMPKAIADHINTEFGLNLTPRNVSSFISHQNRKAKK